MLHHFNIIIHVLTGTLAIVIGIAPFVTKKGGKNHRRFGKLFLGIIAITLLTAMNGFIFFRDRPFLMMLTVLVLYQAVSGYRAVQYREAGPGRFDLIFVLVILGVEGFFLWHLEHSNIVWNRNLVYYSLAYLNMLLFYDVLRIFKVIERKRLWLLEHTLKLTGAFSGLVQAAIGTVCTFWEPYTQLISAGIGSWILIVVLIVFFMRWSKVSIKEGI